MIDGNLAVKEDEPVACAWATCQWGGCQRGRFRLVAIPGVGKLWLCRLHADERRRRKRPAVKVREHDDPRACEWPGGCNRRALSKVAAPEFGELWLCRVHAASVGKASAAAPAARNGARAAWGNPTERRLRKPQLRAPVSPAVKPEPSPARAPTMADVERACEWPDGCSQRAWGKVVKKGVGALWLCRLHRAMALGDPGGVRSDAWITSQAAPSTAAVRSAVKPEPSPAADPTIDRTPLDSVSGWVVVVVWALILVALVVQ